MTPSRFSALTLTCLVCATCAAASSRPQAAADMAAVALADLRAHAGEQGLEPSDVADVIVSSQTTSASIGVTHVYLRQRHRGIEVWGADLTVNVAAGGRVLNRAGAFVAGLSRAVNRTDPVLTPLQAAAAAARHLELTFSEPLRVVRTPAGAARAGALSHGGVAAGPIPVQLMLYPTHPGVVRLAWQLEIEERDARHWWVVLVDAEDGALLQASDRVKQ